MKFQDFQKFKNMIEEALWISYDNDFQIHYKIPPNSCFVKNQFCDESFIAMKQAVRDAFEKESSNRKMFSSLFN